MGTYASMLEAHYYNVLIEVFKSKKITPKAILINPTCNDEELKEILKDVPETFKVDGIDWLDFVKKRLSYYNSSFDAKEFVNTYLKNDTVHPRQFSYDKVILFSKKKPLFIEENNKRHYDIIPGQTTYYDLATKFAEDYAKQVILEKLGYRFVAVKTIDVSPNFYAKKIKEVV